MSPSEVLVSIILRSPDLIFLHDYSHASHLEVCLFLVDLLASLFGVQILEVGRVTKASSSF